MIGGECAQRNKAANAKSQTKPMAYEPAPMNEVVENTSQDMSDMQINTDSDQDDTYSVEDKQACSLMKIDQ